MIHLQPVSSSNIIGIGYKNNTLAVQFRNGLYYYRDVSEDVFNNFLQSSSKGNFFFQNIRGKYEYTKIS